MKRFDNILDKDGYCNCFDFVQILLLIEKFRIGQHENSTCLDFGYIDPYGLYSKEIGESNISGHFMDSRCLLKLKFP